MKNKIARFETRWTQKQKSYFERASSIGGFSSMSEFVLTAVQQKAEEIVEEHENVLASKRDQEIFLNALLNPPKPSSKLRQAAQHYKDVIENDGVPNRSV